MVDLRVKGHCKTCRYWDQRYPQNQQLGICTIMGMLKCSGDEVYIALGEHPNPKQPVVSDVLGVRTYATFGCVAHDPRKQ